MRLSSPRCVHRGLAVLTLSVLSACGGGGEAAPAAPAPAPTPPPAAAPALAPDVEAKEIFATRCTPCHGATGQGDGPASAGLTPKPRNFADKAWQDGVKDDDLSKIIQYGGIAVGKSAAMPANPDLQSKPAVVQALIAHLRGLDG